MKRPTPIVGQRLYSLNVGNAARKEQVLTPVTVSKVGRKYFSVREDGYSWESVFHLDSWLEKTDYAQTQCLYENEQEYLIEKEKTSLMQRIENYFRSWNRSHDDLTLDTLRRISDLLPPQ